MEDKQPYEYFMKPDPEQSKYIGPVLHELDPLTGMEMAYRNAFVGMTRNAPEHMRREVQVIVGFNSKPCHPHIRIDKAKPLQGWYQPKLNLKRNSRPRPCYTEALLTEPYGGYCAVGCAFCYINSGVRGYRGSGLISVPINYGTQVREMLSKINTASAGYFSSFTDPFVNLENIYGNTRASAEAFVEVGLPIFFLSRRLYPSWAIDLLEHNKYSYAQKSLNTGNDQDYRLFSPGAASLESHLADIAKLRNRGIYVSIQVNPVVPGITSHEDIHLLFKKLSAAGANHVIVKFVEAAYSWAPTMVKNFTDRFGEERAREFGLLFTENQGGAQRSIAEAYRREAHQKYQQWATQYGMTYGLCYEYRRRTAADGPGSSWMSMGPEYTTAAQCHGQRVPMFTRSGPGLPFVEVPQCPPSGCLYCVESNNGSPACCNEALGRAEALRLSDLKKPVFPG